MSRETENNQGTILLRYGRSILLGGLIALGFSLIFLFISALGISRGLLDAGLRYQLTVVSCVLGGIVGGIFAVRSCPARGLFVGLAVGGVLFLLQLTLGLLLYESFSLESGSLGLLWGSLCGGAAAGILAGGGKKKCPTRRKKYRSR